MARLRSADERNTSRSRPRTISNDGWRTSSGHEGGALSFRGDDGDPRPCVAQNRRRAPYARVSIIARNILVYEWGGRDPLGVIIHAAAAGVIRGRRLRPGHCCVLPDPISCRGLSSVRARKHASQFRRPRPAMARLPRPTVDACAGGAVRRGTLDVRAPLQRGRRRRGSRARSDLGRASPTPVRIVASRRGSAASTGRIRAGSAAPGSNLAGKQVLLGGALASRTRASSPLPPRSYALDPALLTVFADDHASAGAWASGGRVIRESDPPNSKTKFRRRIPDPAGDGICSPAADAGFAR